MKTHLNMINQTLESILPSISVLPGGNIEASLSSRSLASIRISVPSVKGKTIQAGNILVPHEENMPRFPVPVNFVSKKPSKKTDASMTDLSNSYKSLRLRTRPTTSKPRKRSAEHPKPPQRPSRLKKKKIVTQQQPPVQIYSKPSTNINDLLVKSEKKLRQQKTQLARNGRQVRDVQEQQVKKLKHHNSETRKLNLVKFKKQKFKPKTAWGVDQRKIDGTEDHKQRVEYTRMRDKRRQTRKEALSAGRERIGLNSYLKKTHKKGSASPQIEQKPKKISRPRVKEFMKAKVRIQRKAQENRQIKRQAQEMKRIISLKQLHERQKVGPRKKSQRGKISKQWAAKIYQQPTVGTETDLNKVLDLRVSNDFQTEISSDSILKIQTILRGFLAKQFLQDPNESYGDPISCDDSYASSNHRRMSDRIWRHDSYSSSSLDQKSVDESGNNADLSVRTVISIEENIEMLEFEQPWHVKSEFDELEPSIPEFQAHLFQIPHKEESLSSKSLMSAIDMGSGLNSEESGIESNSSGASCESSVERPQARLDNFDSQESEDSGEVRDVGNELVEDISEGILEKLILEIGEFQFTGAMLDTNSEYVEDYVQKIFKTSKKLSYEVNQNLNTPLSRNIIEVLLKLQQTQIGNSLDVDFTPKPSILNLKIYLEIQKLQTPKRVMSAHTAEAIHIHNKLLFDVVNESLQKYRPYGLKGEPMPWSTSVRHLAHSKQSLRPLHSDVLEEITDWNEIQAGLIPREALGEREADLLVQVREQRLSAMLSEDITLKDGVWTDYFLEEAQVVLDSADMILEDLVVELFSVSSDANQK